MDIFPTIIFVFGFIFGSYLLIHELQRKITMLSTLRIISSLWGIYLCAVYPMINYIWTMQQLNGKITVPDDSSIAFHNWEIAVSGFIIFTFIKRIYTIKHLEKCQ